MSDVTYTADELRGFKTDLDQFFDGQPDDPAYEHKLDVRLSGWSSHYKLVNKVPVATNMAVARITSPAFISQLVDQLLDVMEAGNG